MRYADALRFLYDLRWFGLKLGLENTRRLAALAGNPHERLRFIHVAGTNGKGSTCAMIESIYRSAGMRVGLFTSPHLVSFGERIQVDRVPLTELEVVRLVEEMRDLLAEFPRDHSPTFFEVVTVMAFKHFVASGCQLVVLETGMGGRLDATNIVNPLASVITNVQLDHQQWLGNTISEIAGEKAGIIKPGAPALTASDDPAALEVIRQVAASNRSPLTEITPAQALQPPLDSVMLPLLGDHQRLNAALAVATVRTVAAQANLAESRPGAEAFGPLQSITDRDLSAGLRSVRWPGRLQIFESPGGQITLLDGAHNPAGVAAIAAAVKKHFPGQHPTLIAGILRDKDWAEMCDALAGIGSTIAFVPVASLRTAAPEELAQSLARSHPEVRVRTCLSLEEGLASTTEAPLRIVTGSLYLIGQALQLLDPKLAPRNDERGLNEYIAADAGRVSSGAPISPGRS